MEKEYLNTDEASIFLCVSKSKLMKMCMLREVTYHKAGRLNVFSRKDLQEYLEKNTVLSTDALQNQVDANILTIKNRNNGN